MGLECPRRPKGGRSAMLTASAQAIWTWRNGLRSAERRVRCFAVTGLAYTDAGGGAQMKFLSYLYRFLSNFVFLALVYFSLNFMEKYQHRAVLAMLVLVYSAMRAASALRSFYFFQRIERLEVEARRLATIAAEGPTAAIARKQIIVEVGGLRHAGEMKSYIDLLFLGLVVLLCISKIVTD
jgi:hypothetical protein